MGDGNYYLLTNLISEDEKKVITSIVGHIERGEGNVGIQQIANENFVSPAFIVKFCKRLGFAGYRELFYYLTVQIGGINEQAGSKNPTSMLDGMDPESVACFCALLNAHRNRKIFAVGMGFAEHVAAYMVHRLSICGFTVFNSVHFYDYMIFREQGEGMVSNLEPSLMLAVSQSGESNIVLNDVTRAKQQGFKIIAFTRCADSTLVRMSDVHFIINETKQAFVGDMPNTFFGKVIIAFEELTGEYLRRQREAAAK